MLSESDLYNSNTPPDVKVNPKSLGAMWINYTNGKHYICSNNTFNKNVWLDPIGQLTNEFNSDIENLTNDTSNRFNTINSNINKLTTDTNNIINGINNKIDTTNGNINNITKYMNSNVNSINGKINEINARIDSDISKLEIIETEITRITEKVNNIKQLGINQKWYNETGKRRHNIWYQNTTSAPIAILISSSYIKLFGEGSDTFGSVNIHLNVAEPDGNGNGPGSATIISNINFGRFSSITDMQYIFSIIPPNFYYILNVNPNPQYYNVQFISHWAELR